MLYERNSMCFHLQFRVWFLAEENGQLINSNSSVHTTIYYFIRINIYLSCLMTEQKDTPTSAPQTKQQALITKFWKPASTDKPYFNFLFEKEQAERKKREEEEERLRLEEEERLRQEHEAVRLSTSKVYILLEITILDSL